MTEDIQGLVKEVVESFTLLSVDEEIFRHYPLAALASSLYVTVYSSDKLTKLIQILNQDEIFARFDDLFGKDIKSTIANFFIWATSVDEPISLQTKVSCNDGIIIRYLEELKKTILKEELTVQFEIRILNLDIEEEIHFDDLALKKIPEEEVELKYPWDHPSLGQSRFVNSQQTKNIDKNHRVEAIVSRKIKRDQLKQFAASGGSFSTEESDFILKRITNSLQLTGVFFDHPKPAINQYHEDSILGRSHVSAGSTDEIALKPVMFPMSELDNLRTFYALLSDTSDNVLSRSLARFIRAINHEFRHPQAINRPDYDKFVDYVIALETLLLTVDGNPIDQELSYRFRLNGSSLLSKYCGIDKVKAFNISKLLYEIRSYVVHGNDDAKLSKRVLDLSDHIGLELDRNNRITAMIAVIEVLEQLLRELYLGLLKIEVHERPYKKNFGWERLLWGDISLSN